MISLFNRTENILGKGRKYLLPTFSPFPKMFPTGLLPRIVQWGSCGKRLQDKNNYTNIFFIKSLFILVLEVYHIQLHQKTTKKYKFNLYQIRGPLKKTTFSHFLHQKFLPKLVPKNIIFLLFK